ncbi:DUF4998 domain-containing protein [Mucilaginibacter sp. CAU 1740]|uniref:DUF4998 domain-containing protein n=1 Tax=Mucilaginibacter sp. CAU 1740 TaxID=3140365 RepID=UPI00325B7EDF
MKKLIYILCGCFILIAVYSCKKNHQTDFRNFLGDHEIVYTGSVGKVTIQPGNLEMGLKWAASSDPSITKYVIYYNNKADSQVVNISGKTDTIRAVIKNLAEYTYSFTIYSYDKAGNKSVPTEINNAKVYGPLYIGTLQNRSYNATTPYTVSRDGFVTLNFITPDTINTGTAIYYTSRTDGNPKTAVIKGDSSSITIRDYKSGTPVTYQSSYIPDRNALDVFQVPAIANFPTIIGNAPCDKSLFRKLRLPNDMQPLQAETDLEQLWDGATSPKGYPNIFHNNGQGSLPGTITFDLGKTYTKLTQIEEIGRNCCANPNDFEVWGINDINNAELSVPPTDPNWKTAAVAKGWKLLKEVKRNDDGSAPYKVDLDAGATPVRYIRIRFISASNGDPRTANLSQITMFYDVFN